MKNYEEKRLCCKNQKTGFFEINSPHQASFARASTEN
jgi:hypothetical protein